MKQIALEIISKSESEIVQKCLFRAGGTWPDFTTKIKNTHEKFIFISEDLIITASSDYYSFNARIDDLITIAEALLILDSLVEKRLFLNRSGIKTSFPFKIDTFLKDQYISISNHSGIDINKRIENLIAADIKARLHNKDLVEDIKIYFIEGHYKN